MATVEGVAVSRTESRTRPTALAACVIVALMAATRVHAQVRSVADGLRLNVHASAALLGSGNADSFGVRPGFSASYGNHRLFSAFITYDRVPLNDGVHDFDLQHVDLGARVYLRGSGARLVPFALGSYTWRHADYGERLFLGDTMEVKVHGGGLTLGVGAAYYISPRLALEGSMKRSGGAMERVDANGLTFRHEDSTIGDASLRLNVGVSWWIRRRE